MSATHHRGRASDRRHQRPTAAQPRADTVAPASGRSSWRLALVVFAAALALRVVHVLQLKGAPFSEHLLGDSRGYDEWARQLAAGDWLGSGVFYQAPLYPYWLGSIYALAGRDLLFVRLLQAGAGALACALTALAAEKWFDRKAAAWSGALLACYAPALFFDGLIQKSVLDGLLLSAILLLLAAPDLRPRHVAWLLPGAALGLLALNRENALVLLPLAAVWAWQRAGRRLSAAASVVGAAALVLAPVATRNLAVGGEFHLTTAQLGPNFYIGNHAGATGAYVPLRPERGNVEFEREDATEIAEAAAGRTLRSSEVSAYWLGQAWSWIRANPGAWLRVTGRKALLLVNRTEQADTEDLRTHGEWSMVLRAAAPVAHFGLLGPLAVLGAWITRRRWRSVWLLHGFVAALASSVVAFFVLDRYRYPLVPVLVLFAGAGLAGLGRHWAGHGWAERARTVAVAAIAIAACNWPLRSPVVMQALTHANVGAALRDDGLTAPAEAELRTALRLYPSLAVAHSNLCAILTARGDLGEALHHGREAARLDPGSPAARANLGAVFGKLGRSAEAAEAFTHALRLDPLDAGTHANLGRAQAALGDVGAAVDHLREAVRLDPSNALAHNDLGVLLCSQGMYVEGVSQLETAVRLDPSSGEAAANLERARQLAREP